MDNRPPDTVTDLRSRVWFVAPCGHYVREPWTGGMCTLCEAARLDHELHRLIEQREPQETLERHERRRCRCSVCVA